MQKPDCSHFRALQDDEFSRSAHAPSQGCRGDGASNPVSTYSEVWRSLLPARGEQSHSDDVEGVWLGVATPEMEEKEQLRRQIRLLQGELAAVGPCVPLYLVIAVDPLRSECCRLRSPDGRHGWASERPSRVRPAGDRPARLRGEGAGRASEGLSGDDSTVALPVSGRGSRPPGSAGSEAFLFRCR